MKSCYVCGTEASAVICHDCVKRKEDENAQLQKELEDAEDDNETLKQTLEKAESLLQKTWPYLTHKDRCARRYKENCSCGLTEVLNRIQRIL